LPLENSARNIRVRLTLQTYTGLGFYDASTNVQVRAGARLVAERHDAFGSPMPPIEFAVGRDDVSDDGTLTITIGVDRTSNPSRLGVAREDDRDLGVRLETLEVFPLRDQR
jgi:hypothetical protein